MCHPAGIEGILLPGTVSAARNFTMDVVTGEIETPVLTKPDLWQSKPVYAIAYV